MVRPLLPTLALLAGAALLYVLVRQTEPGQHAAPQDGGPNRVQDTAATMPASALRAGRGTGYRLAGTVVGDLSYAVIEDESGANELLGLGQNISGLGKLVEVGPSSAVFAGEGGRTVLRLRAAPTPTAQVVPTEPRSSPPPDQFPEESFPSDEPDRSAS